MLSLKNMEVPRKEGNGTYNVSNWLGGGARMAGVGRSQLASVDAVMWFGETRKGCEVDRDRL